MECLINGGLPEEEFSEILSEGEVTPVRKRSGKDFKGLRKAKGKARAAYVEAERSLTRPSRGSAQQWGQQPSRLFIDDMAEESDGSLHSVGSSAAGAEPDQESEVGTEELQRPPTPLDLTALQNSSHLAPDVEVGARIPPTSPTPPDTSRHSSEELEYIDIRDFQRPESPIVDFESDFPLLMSPIESATPPPQRKRARADSALPGSPPRPRRIRPRIVEFGDGVAGPSHTVGFPPIMEMDAFALSPSPPEWDSIRHLGPGEDRAAPYASWARAPLQRSSLAADRAPPLTATTHFGVGPSNNPPQPHGRAQGQAPSANNISATVPSQQPSTVHTTSEGTGIKWGRFTLKPPPKRFSRR